MTRLMQTSHLHVKLFLSNFVRILCLLFDVHIVVPLPDALHPAPLMYCLFVKDFATDGQLDGLSPFLVALLQFYS